MMDHEEKIMSNEAFSATLAKLIPAFVKARADIGSTVQKDAVNPHFKNRYASLAAVIDAVSLPLLAHGIVFVQRHEASHDGIVLVTELVHESGEWIRSSLFLPVAKNDAQGFGSAISYARRYALMAICGLAADDDDGEAASRDRPSNVRPMTETQGRGPATAAPKDSPNSLETENMLAKLLNAATDVKMLAAAAAEVQRAKADKSITETARKRLVDVYSHKVAQFSSQVAS